MQTELDMFIAAFGIQDEMARGPYGVTISHSAISDRNLFDPPKRKNMFTEPDPYKFGKPDKQPPSTAAVYKHINEHRYKLINIPDVMSLRSAYELDPTTAGPIKTPFGPEVGAGFFTINWMIQYYAQGVPFQFGDWKDMLDVTKWLEEYVRILDSDLKWLEPEMKNISDPTAQDRYSEAQAYFHMAVTFLDKVKPAGIKMANYYNTKSTRERVREEAHKSRLARLGLKPKEDDRPKLVTKKIDLSFMDDILNTMKRTRED